MVDIWSSRVRREQAEAEARAKAPLPPACVHCGKSEIEHKPEFRDGQLVRRLPLKVPCLGYREHFKPKEEAACG